MAKDRERRLAEDLYVKQRKTAKETANLLGVTEKTIGVWVDKYGWKDRRSAAISSVKSGIENINELINIYTERAIALENNDDDFSDLEGKDRADAIQARVKEKV
ncbi:MAG: YfeC-like transcriptional regulator, partial [Leeuwenhoekiella sp.]